MSLDREPENTPSLHGGGFVFDGGPLWYGSIRPVQTYRPSVPYLDQDSEIQLRSVDFDIRI